MVPGVVQALLNRCNLIYRHDRFDLFLDTKTSQKSRSYYVFFNILANVVLYTSKSLTFVLTTIKMLSIIAISVMKIMMAAIFGV